MQDLSILTSETILADDIFEEIMADDDLMHQARLIIELTARSSMLGVKKQFETLLKATKKMSVQRAKSQNLPSNNNDSDYTDLDCKYPRMYCGGWIVNDNGIRTAGMMGQEIIACYHPIIPVKRLVNLETDKVKMVIAYRNGSRWKEKTVDKGTLSNISKLITLGEYDINVTTDNAKHLVKYFSDIENNNLDLIPTQMSTSKLGWIKDSFVPFDSNIIFDDELKFKDAYESIHEEGNFDTWMDLVKGIRATNRIEPKISIVASLASVLLEPLNALPFILNIGGITGRGKAQPLDTKIITPDGYKLMGDMLIGDLVIGGDGKSHKVIGIYPQGEKDVYELTFKDGTKTRCCKEHLWNVKTECMISHHRDFKVMSLEEMMNIPIKRHIHNLNIPICNAVEFENDGTLPIDAYLLGALIGDGCLTLNPNKANGQTSIYFNNSEDDVIEKVNGCLNEIDARLSSNQFTNNQFRLCGAGVKTLVVTIKDLKLDTYSGGRFIPDVYKYASVEDRKKLLSGLMDTDGCVVGNGSFVYSTTSKQLSDDICFICRSLGYRATSTNKTRDGKSTEYAIAIWTNEKIFTSNKHASKIKYKKGAQKYDKLAIIDIKLIGKEECQCIMVDSEEHTYLCDDFIVTHNTVSMMLATSCWANPAENTYMADAKGTVVSIELRMNFLNHLPLMIDDMSQVKKEYDGDFTKLVYLLCAGKGKDRSNVNLGLNKSTSWKNIILTNYEYLLVTETMQGGAINRIIDIEAEDGLMIENGNAVVEVITQNYGFAGRMFVDAVKEIGFDRVRELQRKAYKAIVSKAAELGVEKEEKQILPMSILLTADIIATEHIFKDDVYLDFDACVNLLKNKGQVSENERAYQFIMSEVGINVNKFKPDPVTLQYKGEVYGKVTTEGYVCIQKNIFSTFAKKGNFSESSFLSWAKKQGLLDAKDGRNTKQIRFDGSQNWCVVLKMGEDMTEEVVEDAEETTEFVKIPEHEQGELPFK